MMLRFAIVLVVFVGCRDATGEQSQPPSNASVVEPALGSDPNSTPTNDSYIPAEHKTGMERFKDVVVYLDGRPIGVLSFGELPITLKPTWVKVKKEQNKPASCPDCLAWKWGEQRFYKFTDYLKALGVPIAKIRELHVQGPRPTNTIVATARDLESKAADGFLFRFGADVGGKPIPRVPENFGNLFGPDKVTAVMIYVTKQPPKIQPGIGFVLDGKELDGVPYYGEPLRGGVRIYLDDRLVTVIKRSELDVKQATQASDGTLHWPLYGFLKSRGVDTSKLVEAWVIRDEHRADVVPAGELSTMSFGASSQASGSIELGPKKLVANAVALHTRAIAKDELPQVRPDEE
jgi:hypothetical protein